MFLSDFFVLNEMSFVIKGEEYCVYVELVKQTGLSNLPLKALVYCLGDSMLK